MPMVPQDQEKFRAHMAKRALEPKPTKHRAPEVMANCLHPNTKLVGAGPFRSCDDCGVAIAPEGMTVFACKRGR